MKRRIFLAVALALATAASCSRDDLRAPRYDAHECPFCTAHKGVCTYCDGTKKCTFCDRKGNRTTVVPDLPEMQLNRLAYQEVCPYCVKGVCRYCSGRGTCWVCNGSGRIESWDFHTKVKNESDRMQ